MTIGGVSAPLVSVIAGNFPETAMTSQHSLLPALALAPLIGGTRYTRAMAEPPDLAALARRYVDLWQDQLTAMAADPALAESTARLLQALVPVGVAAATAPSG